MAPAAVAPEEQPAVAAKKEFDRRICHGIFFPACGFLVFVIWILILPVAWFSVFGNLEATSSKLELRLLGIVGPVTGLAYIIWAFRRCVAGMFCAPPRPSFTRNFSATEPSRLIEVKRMYVIVNPHGGGGAAARVLAEAMHIWSGYDIDVHVKETLRHGHAEEYARELPLDGFDVLAAIGGDGSFHQIVNGLLQRSDKMRIPLALVPAGSGNAFGRDLQLDSAAEAAEAIVRGTLRWCDANTVHDGLGLHRHSINTIVFGMFAEVGLAAESWRRCLGVQRYGICSFFMAFKNPKRRPVIICAEGVPEIGAARIEGPQTFLAINQTQCVGRGVRCTPCAQLDDGLFDLLALRAPVARGYLFRIPFVMPEGRHWRADPEMCCMRGSRLRLVFADSRPCGLFNVDGEDYFSPASSLFIECKQHTFEVVVGSSKRSNLEGTTPSAGKP